MDKLLSRILRESGVKAKITRDSKKPKFKIINNKLTLEGIVTNKNYSMKIKDTKGDIIDELSVAIKDGNELANRINESINTLNKLSPIYDNHIKLKEDEEYEDVPEEKPGDVKSVISNLTDVYNSLMDLAEQTKRVSNAMEDTDIEGKNFVLSLMSSMYDIALDIDKYKEDYIEAQSEPADESISRKPSKRTIKQAKDNITVAEACLVGHNNLKDIKKALKDIRSELITRGF